MIYGEEGFVPKIEIGLKGKKEIPVEDKDTKGFLDDHREIEPYDRGWSHGYGSQPYP